MIVNCPDIASEVLINHFLSGCVVGAFGLFLIYFSWNYFKWFANQGEQK